LIWIKLDADARRKDFAQAKQLEGDLARFELHPLLIGLRPVIARVPK
jgi:hypothetical protein